MEKDFHKNLKDIRSYRKLTQPELAKELGISRSLVAQYELKIYPPIERLVDISKLLNVSIHVIAMVINFSMISMIEFLVHATVSRSFLKPR